MPHPAKCVAALRSSVSLLFSFFFFRQILSTLNLCFVVELSGAMQAMGIVRLLIDPENMITTAVKKVISEVNE